MKTFLSTLIVVFLAFPVFGQSTSVVYLKNTTLTSAKKADLDNIIQAAKAKGYTEIIVHGYAASDGGSTDSRKLSEQRTRVVYQYFVDNNISKSKLRLRIPSLTDSSRPLYKNSGSLIRDKKRSNYVEITVN